MKQIFFTFVFLLIASFTHSQIPKSGIYFYTIHHAEHPNLKVTTKCRVEINGNKVKVIYVGGNLSNIKKGDILDEGIILKHKSGKWIIGKKQSDTKLEEIGGCTDGPSEINFKKKIYWMC
ncbi:hypothetical protein [Flavobacterium sangjuense]|uniref:Uncharacterized protein n=1 Tax=Flavobacterium sangjuense TaxID=2518177 RepID=A0A4P7PWA9_9FLAO|nr:hypothetical protein [Flavobacterium sangjuense]QBZ98690.1 hypothetical protein GS03_02200 [Flavobacterium sangjuense]